MALYAGTAYINWCTSTTAVVYNMHHTYDDHQGQTFFIAPFVN